MTQPTSPYEAQPPSTKRLAISCLVAIAGAAIVLVTVVLPAEYGIDPTGIGRTLGLTAILLALLPFLLRMMSGPMR